MLDRIKKDRLLSACLNNKNGIFNEIKAMRKNKPSYSNTIDGNSENIIKLYNSVDDEDDLSSIKECICNRITKSEVNEVLKITPSLMKEASKNLKSNKSDPVSKIVSDYLINAPDILYKHLSNIMQSYVIHGHLSSTLGICTLLPIIKDKLSSSEDSNNYRSIAISSVILKLFDWIIILLYKTNLHLDHLQFSYQQNCSTSMCTWMVIETIDYFLRNGSEVFICLMDMTKAFDKVKHTILFQKLSERCIPPIILRFIIYMYEIQVANVRWNSNYSTEFKLKNGVKQGAVLSALFYCVYVDDLFLRLRNNRTGCWINGEFMGILGYADDNVLLSPTHDGLQQMIRTCEQYAKEHNLSFSTNTNTHKCKTKCIAFTKNERNLRPLKLCGNSLPWVKSARHLGNTIEYKLDGMRQDMREKRAQFIQKNNELCQEFSFADPLTKVRLNTIYNSHFTGSVTWDLFCKEADSIEKTWNTAMRKMLNLNRCTHRYFIEPLSGTKHIKFSLIQRFINFTQKIYSSIKTPLKTLYKSIRNDCRSITGKNLRNIMLLLEVNNIDSINRNSMQKIKYHEASDNEKRCRINMVKELIEVKRRKLHVANFNTGEVDEILDYLCTT